jgi:hypothetical protein
MAVEVEVEVFCIVTQCSVVVGFQRFVGPYCIHLVGDVSQDLCVCAL